MKKLIALSVVFSMAGILWAQSDSISPGWGNLNYNVDQSPAFKLLGKTPDHILQPTSAKSIALNLGNYYLTNGSVIPKNLSVEISPLLLNPRLSLYAYSSKPFWYRMRVSVGTNQLDNGTFQLAEGLRFTIIDKTDLRTDSAFVHSLYQSCINDAKATNKAIENYLKNHPEKELNNVLARERYRTDTKFKAEIDSLIPELVDKQIGDINKIRTQKKKELWNAPIWEVGMAALQQSPDSLLNHARLMKVGLWSTYGTGFGKYNQLLVGIRFEIQDSLSVWQPNLSIGTRYYYGKNELRYFVQGEYGFTNRQNSLTASAGIVFNITENIWGQFALNLMYDFKGNLSFVPGFNIGLGTAEKKSL